MPRAGESPRAGFPYAVPGLLRRLPRLSQPASLSGQPISRRLLVSTGAIDVGLAPRLLPPDKDATRYSVMSINEGGQAENITDAASLSMYLNPELPPTSRLVIDSYAPAQAREFRWLSSPRRTLKRKVKEAIGQAPEDAMTALRALLAEFDLRAYETQQASKRWSSAYYMLGLPAAVLTTIAGAAGLASTAGRIPAAIVALVAAGLTTAATFLNKSNENMQRNRKLSAAWQELADGVRAVLIQYGQDMRQYHNDDARSTEAANSLLKSVVYFNKRKSALLRGDPAPISEEPQ